MDDAALTRALRARAEGSVDELFDRYASELYDYCLLWLAEPERAADALCYTLLVAIGRANGLVEPARLKPWLYALARNECLRLQQRGGAAARAASGLDRPGRGVQGPSAEPGRRRQGPDAEQEAYELIDRHGMDEAAVASVLGVSLRRARGLATRGGVGGGGSGRRARTQHGWRTAVLPAGLRTRVLADASNPGRIVSRSEAAGPSRRSGFPIPLDQPDPTRRRLLVAAAVVVVLAAATVITVSITSGPKLELSVGEPIATGYVPDATPTPLEPPPSANPSRKASPSVSPKPSSTRPTATPARKPSSPRPPARPPAPRPTVPAPPPAPRHPTGVITGIFNDCLEVVGGSGIELLDCDGSSAQRWTLPGDGTIRAVGGCMNVEGGGTEDRTRVVLAPCTGSGAQMWAGTSDGSLINPRSGKCLDGPNNTSNPKHVEIWGCNGEAYQRWSLPR